MNRFFRKCLALGCIPVLALPALGRARTPSASGGEDELTMTVRIYNYAKVPKRTLRRAQREAAGILRQMGVGTAWLGCRLSQTDPPKDSGCQQRLDPTNIVLRILPRSMAVRYPLPGKAYGFSLPLADGQFGTHGSLFYHRIGDLATVGDFSRAVILGHMIAHEIGHLLLGPQSHSLAGIMRAPWRRTDLDRAARGQLLFTAKQAERIRADVLARIGQQETLQLARLAVPE